MACRPAADIGFVVTGGDTAKLVDPLEEVLDQMTPFVHVAVVGSASGAIAIGWDDGQRTALVLSLMRKQSLKALSPISAATATPSSKSISFPLISPNSVTDDEITFRAAINVLRDTLESRRLPSGLPLAPDTAELHERAARDLEMLLRRAAGALQLGPIGGEDQARRASKDDHTIQFAPANQAKSLCRASSAFPASGLARLGEAWAIESHRRFIAICRAE